MELYEKTISSETVFKGNIVELRVDRIELPDGRPARREVIAHPGGVAILPYHDDGAVTVVRQFRYPFGRVVTELPAGKLERGEDHRACARRELEEETGFKVESPEKLEYLMSLTTTVAFCDEAIDIFVAHNLIPSHQHLDEDEVINVVPCTLEELEEMIYTGKITDGKTIAAIMAYARKYRSEDKKDSMVRG